MNTTANARRRFMLQAVAAAIALPLFGQAFAQALKKLPADNATAKALKYVADAATSQEPSKKPGSSCANCQFFTATTGACSLYAGFAVAPKGWCTAWAKKA
ncbi:MAG: high-potential iron-sulfur protein [Arenimonas sp.]